MGLVRQRYEAFATAESPVLRISYQVSGDRPPPPEDIHAARQVPIAGRRRGTQVELEGGMFRGAWDQATGRMEIDGPLATYPVDRLIGQMVYAVRGDTVIFHAAGLVFSGMGHLCCGPSGSGKSTLAALFPNEALCDEHVAVRLDGETASISALPFWKGRRGSAPLEAIHFLNHAGQNQRRRVSPGEALSRLRSEVIWPSFGEDTLRRAFSVFCDLLERVPVWRLGFRPETTVRGFLTGEASE